MHRVALDRPSDHTGLRALLVIALAVLLTAWLSLRGQQPPQARPQDAPAQAFSAARAHDVLRRVLGDGSPHPLGSAANAAVRDRVLAEFGRLGVPAAVRRRFVCSSHSCATVDNILARLPGASTGQAVLLTAHYDSAAAGPGASDDGAGVAAILEAVRALKTGPLPRDVWILVADGEEAGLFGAEAFVREPEFARIASVVNVEARGTQGASLLIETADGNRDVIAQLGAVLANPGGTSLDYEIYKALPNDTDFTVYRREGRHGANFAWAKGAARYHTPLDSLEHLDRDSLQHHGDNLLATARAFAQQPAAASAGGDAVYFGLLGATLVSWPATWNLPLLALALAGWSLLALRLVRMREARAARIAGLSPLLVVTLAAPLLAGWGTHLVLAALGALPAQWTAQEPLLVAGFMLLTLALAVPFASFAARRFGTSALALTALLPFALLSILAVVAMPGATYIVLLPLLAGLLAGHLAPRRPLLWCAAAAVVTALLWSVYIVDLYSALGHPGLPGVSLLMALALLPLLPVLALSPPASRGLAAAASIACVGVLIAAVLQPAFDADTPRPFNLLYAGSSDAGRLYGPAGEMPLPGLGHAGFQETARLALPWSTRPRMPGPGGPPLSPPTIDVLGDRSVQGLRHFRLRLRSTRGASEATLVLPATVDIASVRIQGQSLRPEASSGAPSGWQQVSIVGLPAEGAIFEFSLPTGAGGEFYAYDGTPGLPARFEAVARLRDRHAVPIHDGDFSLAWVRWPLPAAPR